MQEIDKIINKYLNREDRSHVTTDIKNMVKKYYDYNAKLAIKCDEEYKEKIFLTEKDLKILL